MKNCPKCQASVSDTAKFCNKCGFNIKKYEEENAQTDMFCEECGAKIPSDSAFCPECGYRIEGAEAVNVAINVNDSFNFNDINSMATDQLFEQEGFVVENGVLVSYTGKKRSITIHNVEEIYDGAFENNEVVTFVEIKEGVKIIGKKAFANCKSLVKINVPASVEKIYDNAFEGVCLDTLILPKIDMELIKQCLSENARKYVDDTYVNSNIEKINGAVTVNIKSIEKKAEEEEAKRQAELAKWEIGGNPSFGSYYQSGSKQPIEWIVLTREDNKALLISKYALDCKPYNTAHTNITWENCTLRKWLNNEFINNAFNSEEQGKIQNTRVNNPNNPDYSTNGGNATNDKIFLLSIDEARKYFASNDKRKCKVTAYAKSNGAYDNGNGYGYWWLRSPGGNQNYASVVDSDGSVNTSGSSVNNTGDGVRPALWINL